MIAFIVAMDENGLIGKDNGLPWHYKEDLKFFKEKTLNHTVIMGRKTFDSIFDKLGSPLPKRKNVVLTSQNIEIKGATVIHDLKAYLHTLDKKALHFIIGGKSLYEQAFDCVDVLYITKIHKTYEGDTYFPTYDKTKFELFNKVNKGPLTFETYIKKGANVHDYITL